MVCPDPLDPLDLVVATERWDLLVFLVFLDLLAHLDPPAADSTL